VDVLFQINLWRFTGPLLLIGVGLLLILRPRFLGKDYNLEMSLFGDIRKTGRWEATKHEFWSFIGSQRFDFTDTIFPDGETLIRIIALVDDVKIILPRHIGLWVKSNAFVSEIKSPEGKQERYFQSLDYQTANYQNAEARVKVEILTVVSDISIKQSLV
jgi:lia operon protein LiaF